MLGSTIVLSVIYGFLVFSIVEFDHQETNSACLSVVSRRSWSWLSVVKKIPLDLHNNRVSRCLDSMVHHAWLRRMEYCRVAPVRNLHARTRSWYNQERTCCTALQGKVSRSVGRQEYFASSRNCNKWCKFCLKINCMHCWAFLTVYWTTRMTRFIRNQCGKSAQ